MATHDKTCTPIRIFVDPPIQSRIDRLAARLEGLALGVRLRAADLHRAILGRGLAAMELEHGLAAASCAAEEPGVPPVRAPAPAGAEASTRGLF